ncbi:MAG TPA: hypothetical protein VL403_00280 [Candidatus Kryptonia bacterium]|nr:hypothetical protein [Candidatus Kryptonia bacterium]
MTVATMVLVELTLQTSLYRWLQPAIISPTEGAVVTLPLQVQWDGPPRMGLVLASDGEPARALGLRPSPCELGSVELPKPGLYRLQVRAPLFGSLIQAERRFVVAPPATAPPSPAPQADPRVNQLSSSLEALQGTLDQAQADNAALHAENEGLRQENSTLLSEIERSTKTQEDDAGRVAADDDRLAQLRQENQALTEQLSALQWQLNDALTCRVWGYYAFPRPQTFPPTRRTIMVTNSVGQVFRSEGECEAVRLNDPTTASRCFCVGAPWGG